MRILHVIPTMDPNAGGPPLICTKLAIAQARLGHDVRIMAYQPPPAGRERIAAENGRTPGFEKLTVHELPPISGPERITGRHALAAAKRLIPDVDVVHLHGVWEPQLLHAARVARRHGKPYLVLLNGMLFPWAMARGSAKKQLALCLGWRAMLDNAILHFGSDDEVRAARALGFTKPGVIIPNGAFPDEYADLPPVGTFRAAHPSLGKDPFVLFIGRLHEQKGVDLLLAAFDGVTAQHPTVRLVIAGPDYGAEQAIANPRVLRVGPIYGRAKLAALNDAACFALPSRHEGFSLAVLEALACGVPVAISTECHFPEVGAAGAGVVTSLDVDDIAAGLLRVLSDDSIRGVGRRMVAERYNWMAVAGETIGAYERAMQR